MQPTPFRVGFVPGVTPTKWVRVWRDRSRVPIELVQVDAVAAADALREESVDAVLLRLPVDREGLSVIPLYEERPVVLVSRDHAVASLDTAETLACDDLADDVVLWPQDDVLDWPQAAEVLAPVDQPDGARRSDSAPQPAPTRPPVGKPAIERPQTTADAVELVAAGIGVLVVPQSLARLHHRRDVTYRWLDGAPAAPVALAWLTSRTTDEVERFIGIVRGRTANSSRGGASTQAPPVATDRGVARGATGDGGGGRRAGAAKAGGGADPAGRGKQRGTGRRTTGRSGGRGSGRRR